MILNGKAPIACLRKAIGAFRQLVVFDSQVHPARTAVDGDIQEAFAAFTVSRAQLRQVLDVHVHEAEVIRLEAAVRSAGAIRRRQAAQARGFQDAVDRVTVEMRQEVADHKGEVIQRKAGCATQRTDNGALFIRCFPGQLVRAAGAILTVGRPALAPLADRLGRDAIALGQDPGWLS